MCVAEIPAFAGMTVQVKIIYMVIPAKAGISTARYDRNLTK